MPENPVQAVSRVLVMFHSKSGRSVLWGCWFDSKKAKKFGDDVLAGERDDLIAIQHLDDPFMSYELVWTNMFRETVTPQRE